jgi:hypothetical protein
MVAGGADTAVQEERGFIPFYGCRKVFRVFMFLSVFVFVNVQAVLFFRTGGKPRISESLSRRKN